MPEPVTTAVVLTAAAYTAAKHREDEREAEEEIAAAEAAEAEADAAVQEHIQEQMDDWQETYGAVEDNLGEYYSSLSPDYYAAVGLENFEQEYEKAMGRIRTSLAQRGIDPDSALATSLKNQAQLVRAETRANIRREAPRQAAEEQRSFLELGLRNDPTNLQTQYLSAKYGEARSDRIGAEEDWEQKQEDFEDDMEAIITFGVSELSGLSGGNE